MNHFDNPTSDVKALRERILAWLEAGAPEVRDAGIAGFNMAAVGAYTDCGTVCCIAGAALQFSGEDAVCGAMNDAADLLGIGHGKHWLRDRMFLGGELELEDITPAMAAEMFRGWIETGKIEWRKP
jgi:hypothetical protein